MDLGAFEAALPVKDLARLMAFYEGVGFAPEGGDVEVGVMTFRRGDCRVCLYGPGHLDPDRLQLIFWDGDIEAIAAMVEAAGIPFFRGPTKADDGGGALMLLDPDGHPLFFIHMPVQFINHPGHERVMPARTPTEPLDPDMTIGWFELGLPVGDIRRSFAFYEKLGFRPVGGDLERGHLTLQNRDARIGLHQGCLEPEEPQLIFWQGDVRASAAAFAGQGATVLEGFEDGQVASDLTPVTARMRDPGGQVICLTRLPGKTLSQP